MALFNDKWVRIFDIPETNKHVKGFTLYKIVSIVYPKTCPDAVTKVTVWKRFNDFKKLHRDLKFRHKSMHIVDKYPNLASASYFKRFDIDVINQRKNSVLMFLEFIAIHPPLFKSEEFVKFFETSHSPQESLNSNINIIRAQLNLPNDPEVVYPNSEDEHEGHSDSDSLSTFSSTSASVIHVDDISILDRRSITSTNLNQSLSISNISTISSPDLASRPIRTVTLDNISVHVYPTPPSTPEALLNEVSATHYLIEAAELITKATECEFDKKYHDSFTMYKTAISILLEGVKGDTDSARRQMIRHKIEKYLLRAEKIYHLHLSPEITQIKNLCRTDLLELTPYNIRRPLEDLFNYKILKIIGNGMVVLHKKEQNVFYLKVIQKGPQISNSVYLNIPKDVPYMVKLFQYYDSLNALFIVTQYINGGKLLDHIKQKSQNNVTPVLTMPLENETSRIIDKEFDDVSSESSECSYSDLITDYAIAKKSEATKDQSPEESCSSIELAKTSSDTEESSIVNHESENIQKEEEASDQCTNEMKFEATTENNFRPFLRKISEKSFSEEFSSVNYIPMLADIIKWSSQLLLAIDKLHKIGVVISDLNPRNLLIDEKENLYLTFICNFREKGKLFFRKYENNFYCAPEVHGLYHVTFAADWWSFGAILFELLTGMPLKSVHPEGISNYTILKIPKYVLPEGKSILRQLLVFEPRDRLGCGLNGTEDIKSHPFFNNIDWIKRQVEAFKT